jgi:hypothetical protein
MDKIKKISTMCHTIVRNLQTSIAYFPFLSDEEVNIGMQMINLR